MIWTPVRLTASPVRRSFGRIGRGALFLGLAAVVPIAKGAAVKPMPYSGGITGFSGKQGQDCSSCHSGGIAPTVTLAGPSFVLHDSTRTFTFRLAGGQQVAAGLNVAVDSGTLLATDLQTYVESEELTHDQPRFVDGNGEASWSFDFTAPTTPGALTMWAAGNSVNFSGDNSGDLPATTTLNITVVDNLTSFTEFGHGLAGSGGFVPHLFGIDGPSVGPWSLEIEDGLGGGTGYLWASASTTSFRLFGGDFYVDLSVPYLLIPIGLEGTAGVAGDGSLSIDGDDYSSLAPLTVFAQLTMIDVAAPRRISLSNAIQMDIQN